MFDWLKHASKSPRRVESFVSKLTRKVSKFKVNWIKFIYENSQSIKFSLLLIPSASQFIFFSSVSLSNYSHRPLVVVLLWSLSLIGSKWLKGWKRPFVGENHSLLRLPIYWLKRANGFSWLLQRMRLGNGGARHHHSRWFLWWKIKRIKRSTEGARDLKG